MKKKEDSEEDCEEDSEEDPTVIFNIGGKLQDIFYIQRNEKFIMSISKLLQSIILNN